MQRPELKSGRADEIPHGKKEVPSPNASDWVKLPSTLPRQSIPHSRGNFPTKSIPFGLQDRRFEFTASRYRVLVFVPLATHGAHQQTAMLTNLIAQRGRPHGSFFPKYALHRQQWDERVSQPQSEELAAVVVSALISQCWPALLTGLTT
jgi:hypothetical protein